MIHEMKDPPPLGFGAKICGSASQPNLRLPRIKPETKESKRSRSSSRGGGSASAGSDLRSSNSVTSKATASGGDASLQEYSAARGNSSGSAGAAGAAEEAAIGAEGSKAKRKKREKRQPTEDEIVRMIRTKSAFAARNPFGGLCEGVDTL